MEQSLLGTGWQLLNLAFYFFCLVQSACKKKTDGAQAGSDSDTDSGLEFWDIAAGADKVQKTMKENGWAFEIGYYYAVGLVIFAIVIFYSVHFPPVSFAGLLYFNCKVRSAYVASSCSTVWQMLTARACVYLCLCLCLCVSVAHAAFRRQVQPSLHISCGRAGWACAQRWANGGHGARHGAVLALFHAAGHGGLLQGALASLAPSLPHSLPPFPLLVARSLARSIS